jgi:type I restriction enzyme, R subunit
MNQAIGQISIYHSADGSVATAVEAGQWDKVMITLTAKCSIGPPNTSTSTSCAAPPMWFAASACEIFERIFGLIPCFKSKDELLENEFSKFLADF